MKSAVTSSMNGHLPAVSATTSAISWRRSSFTNAGSKNDSWRISMAWRSGRFWSMASRTRPFTRASRRRASDSADSRSRGSSSKKASSLSASNRKLGGNCHRKGPIFSLSSKIPEAKKLASGRSTSTSRFMCVMKRDPLMANTKPGGVSAYQARKHSGRCSE